MNEVDVVAPARVGGAPLVHVVACGRDVVAALRPDEGAHQGLRAMAAERFGTTTTVEVAAGPDAGYRELLATVDAWCPHDTAIVVLSVLADVATPHEDFAAALSALSSALMARGAHVLVCNASTYDPEPERAFNFAGIEDPPALRIARFDLALLEHSVAAGISVIDADRLLAELGAAAHVVALGAYSDTGYAAIAEEVLRVTADYGFFEARPLLPQVGRGGTG